MINKKRFGVVLGLVGMLASGCHAGWLNPSQPGYVLQTYTTYQPISGNNSGTIVTNGNSYQVAGDNSGLVFISGPGAQFRGKNEGTVYLDGEGGYVMGAFGPLASVTNRGKGSLVMGNLSGGQRATITDVAHGSLLLGAGVVSNSQSIVVGDDNASHGAKSVTAGSFWAMGLGFVGKGTGLTDLPIDLTRFGAAEGLAVSGRVVTIASTVTQMTNQLSTLSGQVTALASKDFPILAGGSTWYQRESLRNWAGVALSADGKRQTAVVQHGVIYVSSDYGETWTNKAFSYPWDAVAMSADGRLQTAMPFTGQLCFSTDYGNTWSNRGASKDWMQVAMSANGQRQTVLEDQGYLYVSTDTGLSWSAKGSPQKWTDLAMNTNGQYQTATLETTEDDETGIITGGGIAVSSDFGNTWTITESGKDWMGVAVSADGKRQAAVVHDGNVYVSNDYGTTWTPKETNRHWWKTAMSADGKRITAIASGASAYESADFGETWSQTVTQQPFSRIAYSANGVYQLASLLPGRLLIGRTATRIQGDLTVDGDVSLSQAGKLSVQNGTQLVFIAGSSTNILDRDVMSSASDPLHKGDDALLPSQSAILANAITNGTAAGGATMTVSNNTLYLTFQLSTNTAAGVQYNLDVHGALTTNAHNLVLLLAGKSGTNHSHQGAYYPLEGNPAGFATNILAGGTNYPASNGTIRLPSIVGPQGVQGPPGSNAIAGAVTNLPVVQPGALNCSPTVSVTKAMINAAPWGEMTLTLTGAVQLFTVATNSFTAGEVANWAVYFSGTNAITWDTNIFTGSAWTNATSAGSDRYFRKASGKNTVNVW